MPREKKPRGSDAKLARLHAMRNQPAASETTLELRRYLADTSSFIVAEAARIIKDQAVPELVGDLVAAFDRLMIDPEESDKQCRAKIEIVDALNRLEYAEPDVLQRPSLLRSLYPTTRLLSRSTSGATPPWLVTGCG
jgi:hypothetical protein